MRAISASLIATLVIACASLNETPVASHEVRLADDSLDLSPEQMQSVRDAVTAVIAQYEREAVPSDFLASYREDTNTVNLLISPPELLGPARRYDAVVDGDSVSIVVREGSPPR